MTPIARHLRGGEHVTIIRAPGEPMPAWLGGGCPERHEMTLNFAITRFNIAMAYGDGQGMAAALLDLSNGETPTLPPYEERT